MIVILTTVLPLSLFPPHPAVSPSHPLLCRQPPPRNAPILPPHLDLPSLTIPHHTAQKTLPHLISNYPPLRIPLLPSKKPLRPPIPKKLKQSPIPDIHAPTRGPAWGVQGQGFEDVEGGFFASGFDKDEDGGVGGGG